MVYVRGVMEDGADSACCEDRSSWESNTSSSLKNDQEKKWRKMFWKKKKHVSKVADAANNEGFGMAEL